MAEAYSFMANQPKTNSFIANQSNTGLAASQDQQKALAWRQQGGGMASIAGGPTPSGQFNPNNQAATPGSQADGGGWNLPPWSPNVPSRLQAGVSDPGAPRTGGGGYWGSQFDQPALFRPGSFSEPNTPYSRMLENALPVSQFLQNSSQYQQDYNEAQRRWNLEQGWGQSTDQFNMGLEARREQAAEEQARLYSNQWDRQFDWTRTTDQWGRELGLGELANRQQETSNTGLYQRGLISNQATENANTKAYQTGLIQVQQRGNEIEDAYRRGLISNEQRSLALEELTQKQNNLIQRQQANTQQQEVTQTGAYQQGQLGIQRQANTIDQMWKSGQLSNEQRSLALHELTQQQTFGLQGQTLAEQRRSAQAAEALRQQEINQQMQIAAMQAYGRSVAPNARWSRNWA